MLLDYVHNLIMESELFFLSTLICKACSESRLVSKSCVAKSVAAQIELDWRSGR